VRLDTALHASGNCTADGRIAPGKPQRGDNIMQRKILLAALIAAAPLPAFAQSGDQAVARSLAATCAACHGTEGRGVPQAFAALAGRPKGDLVSILQAYKTGKIPATVMHQLSKGYTDEQIEMIAAYFAAKKN
jgi:sulfide dehydrogenase cytochrome subunit